MEVIHALWDSDKLLIWGENSESGSSYKRPRGRPPKTPKPHPHPFSIPSERMREIINNVLPDLPLSNVEISRLDIMLPSYPNGPSNSPELIVDRKTEGDPDEILPWSIDVVKLGPGDGLELLLSLQKPPFSISLGSSLRFWSEAAKLSISLISGQRFSPFLNKVDDVSCKAEWNIVASQRDEDMIGILERAMPPICYLFNGTPDNKRDIIIDFMNSTVDSFIRSSTTSILKPLRGRPPKIPDISREWIKALTTSDPIIKGHHDLYDHVTGWIPGDRANDQISPFRMCFRLDPPEIDENEWWIGFFLQARDDPSLLIDVGTIWDGSEIAASFVKRKLDDPEEWVLKNLGHASRIYGMIETSLDTSHPRGLNLGPDQAYEFLQNWGPQLEQSGFCVRLPNWWRRPESRLGVKLVVSEKKEREIGSGLLGKNSLVDFDWQIALGDSTLSKKEFLELVKLKSPLVKVRGEWMELNPDSIAKAREFFKKGGTNREMEFTQALRIGLGMETSEIGLDVIEIEGKGSMKAYIDRMKGKGKIQNISVPKSFCGTLRPYQKRGLSWLLFLDKLGLGACLADDMGLGKTIQLIALLLKERVGKKRGIPPTLVICPMSVVGNWRKEIERFAPTLNVLVHHGNERSKKHNFKKNITGKDVVITTYSLANRDAGIMSGINWHRIVLDEAQKIKNPDAKQTRAIRSLKAERKVAMTGTPVENRLSELWSIMDFLNSGYLGSRASFNKSFSSPIQRYRDAERTKILRRLVQPFLLRRMKTDKKIIRDLPEKSEMKTYCNLTKEQGVLYEAVVKDMMEAIEGSEGITRKGLILSTLMKLKQVCNHPAQFLHDGSSIQGRSGKLTRLEEMLSVAISEGDRSLLFTQFREMGEALRSHLQTVLEVEVIFLHGGTTQKNREKMIERFQNDAHGPPIFILSLKAGGLGLNLTSANRVFHFDRWWNPAVEDQATDRAYRIGQKKNVLVHKFITIGTVEEKIDQMIENKKELAESIVGSGEGWITEMSMEKLRELFSLSREAIGGE